MSVKNKFFPAWKFICDGEDKCDLSLPSFNTIILILSVIYGVDYFYKKENVIITKDDLFLSAPKSYLTST